VRSEKSDECKVVSYGCERSEHRKEFFLNSLVGMLLLGLTSSKIDIVSVSFFGIAFHVEKIKLSVAIEYDAPIMLPLCFYPKTVVCVGGW
jgi:hypothetical protein